MKTDSFELVKGFEESRARAFLNTLDKLIEGFEPNPPATLAYLVLDSLYKAFVDEEKDFGYIVGFANEDTPLIEDVNYIGTWQMYNTLVSGHGEYQFDADQGHYSKEEVFELFWSLMAKQVLEVLPTDFDALKKHIKTKVTSMFNGYNPYNVKFFLWYVELDHDDSVYKRTDDLGDSMTVLLAPPTKFTF